MTIHTLGVGLSVTPTVTATIIDHYLNRKKRKQKPTAHISYDVALNLIRRFLVYASNHTVEDVQAFTAQWVPTPTWIHTEHVTIPSACIEQAADAIVKQLGPEGVKQVGGKTWWRWRRENSKLRADWIEMKSDWKQRQKSKQACKRVMLYVHGGAYFFGSVDEHRYQMQRHARKLKARVFAPRYRLAPQFPFPCGLLDCLAAYLYLLTVQDPTTIVLAGDSAGGGMVVSLLVILREMGLPMPTSAILISPWCDLTHSFPSVAATNDFDYIPPYGFMQKPSMAWPPPNADDLKDIRAADDGKTAHNPLPQSTDEAAQGFVVKNVTEGVIGGSADSQEDSKFRPSTVSLPEKYISLVIDGKEVYLRDQIQMYTTNELLAHPLVSPVLQPSLGGLPPLLILTGGGEMLRDEQIYLAHKAARPAKYPPGEAYLERTPGAREQITKYPPTLVQLQVWDDLCHVAPTLSFTRPAKYMYRSIAQFGAWALAQAQKLDIEFMDDEAVSMISTETTDSDESEERHPRKLEKEVTKGMDATEPTLKIGKAGDDIPHFRNHMVRQRVDRHGNIYDLYAEEHLPALQMSRDMVGVVKPGPVRKWMKAKSHWDTKYAQQKRRVQKQRLQEMRKGYREFKEHGVVELPPPSALAVRRGLPGTEKAPRLKKSMGLQFWSMMGSSHDKNAVDREEKLDRQADTKMTVTQADGSVEMTNGKSARSRSGSKHRTVSYQKSTDENATAAELITARDADDRSYPATAEAELTFDSSRLSPTFVPLSQFRPSSSASRAPAVLLVDASKDPLVLQGTNVTLASPDAMRPKADGVAFPFKLGKGLAGDHTRNASTITITSAFGVGAPGIATPETEESRPLTATNGTTLLRTGGVTAGPSASTGQELALKAAGEERETRTSEPVKTETPMLEKQLDGATTGDQTPRGTTPGFATPRAGSISTAAPSESGDRPTLDRFQTAEELL